MQYIEILLFLLNSTVNHTISVAPSLPLQAHSNFQQHLLPRTVRFILIVTSTPFQVYIPFAETMMTISF